MNSGVQYLVLSNKLLAILFSTIVLFLLSKIAILASSIAITAIAILSSLVLPVKAILASTKLAMAEFKSPKKRPRPIEFDSIASIDEVSDGYIAKIHGVITSVSPIKGKTDKKFYDGFVSDGKKKLRFVGFNAAKAKQLQEFAKDQQPITLTNCCVKSSRYEADKMEFLIGDSTDISKSVKMKKRPALHKKLNVNA